MSEEIKIENNSILSGGYGLIPQIVARDKSISIGAKGLYSYLSSIAGAKGTCYPTRDLITHELNIGKNTFSKYLSELKDRGYIKVTQRRAGKGKMLNNVYEIVFDKRYIDNMLITSPCTKKEDTVNVGEIAPCTKISDTDEHIENTASQPCTKKEDTEGILEFQHSTPCPCLPYTVNEDSNSNSININCCSNSNISFYNKQEPVDKNNPLFPIAVFELKKRISFITHLEAEKVAEALMRKEKKIPYLIEKINITLDANNVDNVVGYLIRAIEDDYKVHDSEDILEQQIQEYYAKNR